MVTLLKKSKNDDGNTLRNIIIMIIVIYIIIIVIEVIEIVVIVVIVMVINQPSGFSAGSTTEIPQTFIVPHF